MEPTVNRKSMQNEFKRRMGEIVSSKMLTRILFKTIVESTSIVLTKTQKNKLKKSLKPENNEDVDLKISNRQLKEAGYKNQAELDEEIEEKIAKFNDQSKEKTLKMLEQVYTDSYQKYIKHFSDEILKKVNNSEKSTLRKSQKEQKRFYKGQLKIWGESLDKLEVFIEVVADTFEYFYPEIRYQHNGGDSASTFVLVRLNARACRIAREILLLLRNGWSDGAHARWRALHETTVVSIFISNHGETVAQKYIDHEKVQTYKHELSGRANDIRSDESDVDEYFENIKTEYESIKEKYGAKFKRPYGWADDIIELNRPVTFVDIEQNIFSNRFRFIYKWASDQVHANSSSILYSLGAPPYWKDFFVGPSAMGAVQPGKATAYSLWQIFTYLLLYENSTLDRHVYAEMLWKFKNDVLKSFEACNDRIVFKFDEEE